ncbi:MAG: mechanosensitive ion channel domain-containing protein [Bdellovibrionota bacterium]|nr:mechanosensitive ion channel domain-containing protein [Bdellovibrionota bacterium]
MDAVGESLHFVWKLLSTPIFELSGNKISVFSVVLAGGLLWSSFVLARAGEALVRRALEDRDIDPGVKASLERFSRYLIVVLGIWIALDSLGFNLSSLAAFGAVLGVGIGFGLQNITQNFISGIIILIERPIKKGDMVEVKGVRGKVLDIQARSTLILTRDDVVIIVPNSQFISEQVVNDSFSGEKIRLNLSVGVAYGSDVELVKSTLVDVAYRNDKVLKSPHPKVLFHDFGDSALVFDLRVWVDDLWDRELVLSDLRFSIDKAFREKDITIPFPQRDLHLVSSSVNFLENPKAE